MPITVHNDGILTPGDVARIEEAGARWAFDAQVVVKAASSKASFESEMRSWVQTSNTVAIGLDPVHRSTIVRFGDGTQIRAEQWNDVTHAGDASFRKGEWAGGIIAIGERGVNARTETAARRPVETTPQNVVLVPAKPEPMSAGTKAGIGLVVALIVGCVAAMIYQTWGARKRARELERLAKEAEEELEAKRERERDEKDWHAAMKDSMPKGAPAPVMPRPAPPRAPAAPRSPTVVRRTYVASAPAPVTVVNQSSGGGSGDLALGYLIGESAGRRESSRPAPASTYRAPEPAPARPSSSSSSSSSSSYDSGGSNSSWSGSSDSGGSSSDWGGGGGGDIGGGSSGW